MTGKLDCFSWYPRPGSPIPAVRDRGERTGQGEWGLVQGFRGRLRGRLTRHPTLMLVAATALNATRSSTFTSGLGPNDRKDTWHVKRRHVTTTRWGDKRNLRIPTRRFPRFGPLLPGLSSCALHSSAFGSHREHVQSVGSQIAYNVFVLGNGRNHVYPVAIAIEIPAFDCVGEPRKLRLVSRGPEELHRRGFHVADNNEIRSSQHCGCGGRRRGRWWGRGSDCWNIMQSKVELSSLESHVGHTPCDQKTW